MLESLQQFLLFGSYVWFWVAVGLLIISFFISDLEEQGYGAFFSFLLFLGITHFWGNFNILDYINWGQVLFYLLVGFTYSFVRTFFYAKKYGENGRQYLKENVFRWWFLWPISLINWAISDLIKQLYNFIYDKLVHFYDEVFNLGLKK